MSARDGEGPRRYRVGDIVRVVRGDRVGEEGAVTKADYARRVPLVVDLPSGPRGIGICYSDGWVELVKAAPPPTPRDECAAFLADGSGNLLDKLVAFVEARDERVLALVKDWERQVVAFGHLNGDKGLTIARMCADIRAALTAPEPAQDQPREGA